MFIIIMRSAFTYIMGATLIQYAHTLTNKPPTTTHQKHVGIAAAGATVLWESSHMEQQQSLN